MSTATPATPRLRGRWLAVHGAFLVLLLAGACSSAPAAPPAAPASAPSPAAPDPFSTPSTTTAPAPAPSTQPSAPTSVALRGIGVSSDLVDLGLQADGSLEVPTDFARAGWFTGGGRPGAPGPVVIAGHVDSRDGPAVFYRLRDLAVGDTVELTTADGAVSTYQVDAVNTYAKDAFPTTEVFGATPDDVLRLITCGGAFDRSLRSYTDNLVVTATRA